MINTSYAYRKALAGNREFRILDRITFQNGTTLKLSISDFMEYSINEATSDSGKFEIGAAVIKEYSATLNNEDGRFDSYDFEGADLRSVVGLRLADGSWEDLDKGTYRIVSAKASELTIQIVAYDNMLFFDKPYKESSLKYPATITEIVRNACIDCHVTFDAATVEMGNYNVKKRPDDENLTYRDVVSYCAQIMGCYARINHLNKLTFGWYSFASFENNLDGGTFSVQESQDGKLQYVVGDVADGGDFTDYNSGDTYDGQTFADMKKFHHLHRITEQTINTDDISITGIKVYQKEENEENVKAILYGKEGYVLEISDNPLIQRGSIEQVAAHIGEKIVGNTFRPLSISCQSDPCVEAGDIAYVTDRKQRVYRTVITNTSFNLGGTQKVECTAETPTEKNYTKYSVVTKLMDAAKKQVNQKLSAYDIASRELSELMANSMGLYETYEILNDGSQVLYQHDKPKLSESQTIWKKTIGAFAVSTDGGNTWKAGIDAGGNALFTVLSTIGINADWINSGTINADLIKTGTINADLINSGTINADLIKAGTLKGIKIIGKSGSIGGFTITSTKLYAGNEDVSGEVVVEGEDIVGGIVGIQAPTDSNLYAFFAGANSTTSFSSAPFRVTKYGKLYASNAVISGKMRNVSGDTFIELDDGILRAGNISNGKSTTHCKLDCSAEYTDGTRNVSLIAVLDNLMLGAKGKIFFTDASGSNTKGAYIDSDGIHDMKGISTSGTVIIPASIQDGKITSYYTAKIVDGILKYQ